MTARNFRAELPGGGGGLELQSAEELDRWTTLEAAYREQYDLRKINDLTNLATLLVQHINLYRAQQALSGRVPEIDEDEMPTGRYVSRQLKAAEVRAFQEQINTASKEVREIERTMGIDKKSRDSAGDESIKSWLTSMKARSHRYGLHVSGRVKAYEEFVMELRWRLRLNEIGDAEDKAYENVSDADIVKWCREQLTELEKADQEFAKDEGALILGSAI
jgi:cobalamin biosynthesis Mg chelatase CobN